MKFQGSVITEQGVTFAIIVVKYHIIQNNFALANTRDQFSHIFPGMPIILMAQNSRGIPIYQGRKDIINFLSNIHLRQIPWKEYEVA